MCAFFIDFSSLNRIPKWTASFFCLSKARSVLLFSLTVIVLGVMVGKGVYYYLMIQSYEVVVFAYTLKNMYLSSKGLYTVRLTMQVDYNESFPLHQISHPYILFKSKLKANRQSVSGKPALNNNTFVSEQVEMRFMDQEVFLLDVIGYKIEIRPESNSVTLICELDKEQIASEVKTINRYESRVKISSLKQGICEYIEIPFQQNHEISLNLCLFSILSDCKQPVLRPPILAKRQNYKEKQRVNVDEPDKNLLKEIRFHSFITQQNLSTISLKQLPSTILPLQQAKEYFYPQVQCISNVEYSELLYQVCTENYIFFKKFLQTLESGSFTLEKLKENHSKIRKQKYTDFVFSKRENQWFSGTQERIKCAKKVRKSSSYQSLSKKILPVQIEGQFIGLENQPIAFYEIETISCQWQLPKGDFKNLYVLCHGFQGSPKDLILLRNNIKYFDPEASFLLAASYCEDFNNSILAMGERLAAEIKQFMKDNELKLEETKLNFIGFSLGGIVARASLKHLNNVHYGRYTSISAPHLGSSGSQTLVSFGLFMLRNLCNYKCITQLCFCDSSKLQQATLYKLSQEGSLNCFQQVVLVTNNKDTFVPWQSARIQPLGGKIRKIEDKMIENTINNKKNLRAVHRLDFDCKDPKASIIQHPRERIEEVIGRAAHMQFIKSDIMIRMMLNAISL